MSKTHYIPPSSHIPLIRSGEISKFLVMVKPQPKGSDVIKIGGTDSYSVFEAGECEQVKAPYTIGQEVAVKESWQQECVYVDTSIGWGYEATGQHVYKADGVELPDDSTAFGKWRSPVTQPLASVRTWIVPTGVKVVRVQSILSCSEDIYPLTGGIDGIDCGRRLYRDFIAKHGQSAWDSNAFVFLYDFKLKQ